MEKFQYVKDVVTLSFDRSLCTGCGMCVEVCPHGVFAIGEDIARIKDRDACMECGACANNCSEGAISVDAGVGCAYAVIKGDLTKTEPGCGPGSGSSCCE
jgi:NAD-dependent dihydropyrimidine dehydrogenase PreA subunit